ncbi:hypothetical protein B005_4370 [Nocardiopsis alba ATCC BAA-2165]|uniref:Uncharacterized protein n=1 Tax=Nocardiopsis alba (strain ATCC BAA-2165 / BE74) TaxID=1205910 RepID=J7KYK8_NOCAA|nr:hypothetical protein B005_4370 [Nocardiopsis alba ATCC BAA-2165]
MNIGDVLLRRAEQSDALAAADVWLRSFATALHFSASSTR